MRAWHQGEGFAQAECIVSICSSSAGNKKSLAAGARDEKTFYQLPREIRVKCVYFLAH